MVRVRKSKQALRKRRIGALDRLVKNVESNGAAMFPPKLSKLLSEVKVLQARV